MKHKLLTSTAVGALLAASSYAYAEGVTLKFFGGLNFLGDESHEGLFLASTEGTVATFSTGPTGVAGTLRQGFYGDLDFDADTGYVFGGAVGYQWDNGLILEVEAAYRRNKQDFGGSGTAAFSAVLTGPAATGPYSGTSHFTKVDDTKQVTIDGDGHVSAVSLMANAWYEFNLSNDQWKPYVGGGVGIAWLDMHGLANRTTRFTTGFTTGSSTIDSGVDGIHGDESGFAWQLGAGVGYEFAPGKQITLDYRYFNGPTLDDVQFNGIENDVDYDYASQNVMIGVRLGL